MFEDQNIILRALLITSSVVLVMLPVWCWPSRWNVWSISTTAPIFFAGFMIPCIFDPQVFSGYSKQTLQSYTLLMVVGAISATCGLMVASKVRGVTALKSIGRTIQAQRVIEWRCVVLLAACAIGLVVSFLVMGKPPALSDDPMTAKYLKDEVVYSRYKPIAPLYRGSILVYACVIPICIPLAANSRRIAHWLLIVTAVVCMLGTLYKAPTIFPVLMGFGFLALKFRNLYFFWLLLLLLLSIGGTLFNQLYSDYRELGSISPLRLFDSRFAAQVTAGAPDIPDALRFLHNFDPESHMSYGRTFIGGLVPFQYQWNPGIYSLKIGFYGDIRAADTMQLRSGGFRLSSPIWGYSAFGWLGAIAVPFLSAVAMKVVYKSFLENIQAAESLSQRVAVVLLASAAADLFGQFYFFSYYKLLPLVALLVIVRAPVLKLVRRSSWVGG